MKTRFLSLAAACLALSGCMVVPLEPQPGGPAIIVDARPPMPVPRVEFLPTAPGVDFVWIGGCWTWVGSRYSWAPGYWRAPYHWHPEPPRHPEPRYDEWNRKHIPEQPHESRHWR